MHHTAPDGQNHRQSRWSKLRWNCLHKASGYTGVPLGDNGAVVWSIRLPSGSVSKGTGPKSPRFQPTHLWPGVHFGSTQLALSCQQWGFVVLGFLGLPKQSSQWGTHWLQWLHLWGKGIWPWPWPSAIAPLWVKCWRMPLSGAPVRGTGGTAGSWEFRTHLAIPDGCEKGVNMNWNTETKNQLVYRTVKYPSMGVQ